MNTKILTIIALAIFLAGCSATYKQGQTPDDVYYSPGKEKTLANADTKKDDSYANNNSDYQSYTTSSDDQYLRMKTQNRYRWNSLDDNDYWSSPSYAFSNYYGNNSFNPLAFNSWGLSYYYSPFASIQPYSWFNNYYPTYGYYENYGGYYGHGYGYGYSPVYVSSTSSRYNVHRPMLGGYVNNSSNSYNNGNRYSSGSRYIPANNTTGRYYNNGNSSANRTYNDNSFNRTNTNSNYSNTNTAPSRSFTPSSSGSSSGGGGVTRQPR